MDTARLIIGAVLIVLILIVINALRKENARKKAQARKAAEEAERKRQAQQRAAEEKQRRQQWQAVRDQREAEIEEALSRYPAARKYRLDSTQTEVSSSLLSVTAFTPVSKKRYVAFDLETTGLSGGDDAIVEIGAVRVVNGIVEAEYHQLVDPNRPMPADASAINHITDDMLRGMPKIHQALPAFLAFVGDDVLAAHNARFDAKFINQACMRTRFAAPQRYFDTMELARYWPEAANRKLVTLAQAAGIENDAAHRALGDARAVAALIAATNTRRGEKSHHKQVQEQ